MDLETILDDIADYNDRVFENTLNVIDDNLEFIEENEGFDRQFYAGYLGMITHRASAEGQKNTEAELYVNLRCMSIEGPVANVFIGSGITTDSNPLKEWEETVSKTETMKTILKY